jgi:hypothetical protein
MVIEMTSNWTDDDQLIAALAAAVRDAAAVPQRVLGMAKSAFVWNDQYTDAEFAALAYDSNFDSELELTRADLATLRSMVFQSSRHRIELELSGVAIHGQIVPPEPASIETVGASGRLGETEADPDGWFVLQPIPDVPFRLLLRLQGGPVLTQVIAVGDR